MQGKESLWLHGETAQWKYFDEPIALYSSNMTWHIWTKGEVGALKPV